LPWFLAVLSLFAIKSNSEAFMIPIYLIGGVIALALFAYLLVALLKPEAFS
jgi:K+-transporting ATPase KdpF subunit